MTILELIKILKDPEVPLKEKKALINQYGELSLNELTEDVESDHNKDNNEGHFYFVKYDNGEKVIETTEKEEVMRRLAEMTNFMYESGMRLQEEFSNKSDEFFNKFYNRLMKAFELDDEFINGYYKMFRF